MAEIKITTIGELPAEVLKMGNNLTRDELRTKAEKLAEIYTNGLQEGDNDPRMEYPTMKDGALDGGKEVVRVYEMMEECVNKYTAISREECFNDLKTYDDPMHEAVIRLVFPTIRIDEKKVGEDKVKFPVVSIVDSTKPIDLLKLHNAVDGGIGADKNWMYAVEKLNFLLTAQKAVDLGINPKNIADSYAMNAISRDIDMGKTPTSKTNILRTLGIVISAMIGEEYKPTSHDVNFLLSCYSRKSRKALTVVCANHKYLRQYLAEICHRIILGKSYEVDYKKVQQKQNKN